jgi:hypothetical protein
MERRSPDQRPIRYGGKLAERLAVERKPQRYQVQVRSTFVRLPRRGPAREA